MDGKNTSRFSTLRVFKLAGTPKPPPPPPKDAPGPYNITPYAPYITSTASTSQLTLNTFPASSPDLSLTHSTSITMRSPISDDARFLHPHSPMTPPYARNPSPSRPPPATGAFKKGLSKLTSFGKRPAKSHTVGSIPSSPSMSALHEHQSDDDRISGPWNFQHHMHVNGDLHGMPPSWTASLREKGFSDDEIAAFRTRRRHIIPPLDDPPEFSSTSDPPQFTSSAPSSSSGVVMLVKPKPRSDSLRRPVPERSASAATTLSYSSRRPPSPTSSSSSHPATSVHTNTGSSEPHSNSAPRSPQSPESPSASPATDTHSHSLSQSSSRAPPPAPLSLRPFRVVNGDPDPVTSFMSPPPAYAASAPTPIASTLISAEKGPRRRSTEKPPIPEPDTSTASTSTPSRVDAVVTQDVSPVEEDTPPMEEDLPLEDAPPEAKAAEEVMEAEEQEEDDFEAKVSPSLLARTAALPPRLSLHTDQDDDWGDMFSFLPSSRGSVTGSSKRISFSTPGRSTPPARKRESVQDKRRSKRFITTLALAPSLYTHTDVDTPISPPQSQQQPATSDLASGQTRSHSPRVSHSPSPTPSSHPSHESEPSSSTTVYPPNRSTADIGILTPDPAYPIANSPLWEEVRTLVREGGTGGTPPVEGRTQPILEPESQVTNALEMQEPTSVSEAELEVVGRHSEVLLSPPPELRSRFSHDSEAMEPSSRFSDATSFQGHSRFSETLSLGDVLQDSVLSSRFSAWSATSHAHSHGHPSAYFSTLEAMPESPMVSPVPTQQQQQSQTSISAHYPPPRRSSDLPPPLPPPKNELPPPPPPQDAEDDDDHRTADESRASELSQLSGVQIHGARIATRVQANVVPARPTVSPSTLGSASSSARSTAASTPVTSPQNDRPPPLPLPPLGKVLPSLIASQRYQERRRQYASEEEAASQDSHGHESVEGGTGRISPTSGSSSSPSRFSSNSAESGPGFGSSFGHGDYDPRSLSVPAASYEEPPKSPMLAYLEDAPQQPPTPGIGALHFPNGSANGASGGQSDDDDDDTVPLSRLREKLGSRTDQIDPRAEEGSSPEDEVDIIDDWIGEGEGERSPEQVELEASLVESPGVYDHDALPPPPFITVNGCPPSTKAKCEPEPEPEPAFQQQEQEEEEEEEEDMEDEEEQYRELPPALEPLRDYISLDFDPREMFSDLQEVAQGQYGSVYAARMISIDSGSNGSLVAVKHVPIPESGTYKIDQLRHELGLMSQVRHKHILGAEGLFFDFVEDSLWIRMELMERSLADVIELSEVGLELQEQVIARFASDTLLALAYLSDLGIAHRDVRSDNLLMTGNGVLKLADFSNGVRVTRQNTLRFEIVGVHHWQAPEMRRGGYDALKVDVWSLGATVYEMAEHAPPFADIEDTRALSDRWPPLSRADDFSDVFHDFLRLCSEPPATRPQASQLLHHPFIQQASPRETIQQTLRLCRELEEGFQRQSSADS